MAKKSNDEILRYVERRAEEAEARDGERNKKFDRIELMRHRQHEVPVPERYKNIGVKTIKVSLLNEVFRVIISTMAKAFPTFNVPRRRTAKEEQENTSRREKWLMGLFRVLDTGQGGHRSYIDAIDNAVVFGLAVNKVLYLPDAWDKAVFKPKTIAEEDGRERDETDAEYNERVDSYKQGAAIPFAWLVPDPRTFHPYYLYRQLSEVVEVSERARYDIAETYREAGVRLDSQTGRLRSSKYGEAIAASALGVDSYKERIKHREFWDEDELVVLSDGIIVQRHKHRSQRPPYFSFFGLSTASHVPQWECMGIGDDMLDLVEALDQGLTTLLSYGYITAYPMGFMELPPGMQGLQDPATGKVVVELKWEPGLIKYVPAGAKLNWFMAPQAGGDLVKMVEILMNMADRAGAVPDIMRGEPTKQLTASGQSQLLTVATRIFDPISGNAAVSFSEMAKYFFYLTETRHHDIVYVMADQRDEKGNATSGWLGLGPSDIGGYHAATAEIVTLTEERRIQEGMFGLQVWGAKGIPKREFLENYMHYSAPEELMLETDEEDFRNGPMYKQMVNDWLARRIGAREARQMGAPPEQVAALAAAGQAPPGFPPGVQPIAGAPATVVPTPGLGMPLAPPIAPPGEEVA